MQLGAELLSTVLTFKETKFFLYIFSVLDFITEHFANVSVMFISNTAWLD